MLLMTILVRKMYSVSTKMRTMPMPILKIVITRII